jgi:hypothetical protein
VAALTDFADYVSRLEGPRQLLPTTRPALTTIAGRPWDMFIGSTPQSPAAPTTAVVPAKSTGFNQENGATEQLFALGGTLGSTQSGLYVLCDRLSHQGGLSGTVTGSITTNLPTAALTRYTTGVGVMAAISIYTQIGTTATTITAGYTDQDGGAKTTPAMAIGATGFREASRMLFLPLATGDTGVRAITSSNLLATTGTAGAFGYTLFKPLMSFHIDRPHGTVDFSLVDGGMSGGVPEILDDACLFWMCIPAGASTSLFGDVRLTTK